MIRIILADDHKIVLEGLSSLIRNEKNIQIVGTAMDGIEALNLIQNEDVDIAVLDIEMPKLNGVELTKKIRTEYPNTKVLILTMYNQIGFIRRIVEAGANGYILKNKGAEELIQAIEEIQSGGEFFGKDVTKTLISSIKNTKVSGEIKITRREIEVLKLIANGDTTRTISEKLHIAPTTVETHRRNLIEKTGVTNSKGLVRFAVEHGYI